MSGKKERLERELTFEVSRCMDFLDRGRTAPARKIAQGWFELVAKHALVARNINNRLRQIEMREKIEKDDAARRLEKETKRKLAAEKKVFI